ncbi:MAG: hypothetical protein J7647_30880 [Cyanobacteria bacterium SBLK]|nr:hypothetical protein [Cyanobacteria bacterium SBLK]
MSKKFLDQYREKRKTQLQQELDQIEKIYLETLHEQAVTGCDRAEFYTLLHDKGLTYRIIGEIEGISHARAHNIAKRIK